MGFKDILESDLNAFFEEDEFADTHLWNKNTIKAIVDDEALIMKYSSEFELLPKGSRCIMAPAKQFQKKPMVSEAIYFDKILYTVDEVQESAGVYTIFLARGNL